MHKSYLHSVVWIVLATILALLLLAWLPQMGTEEWQWRQVDLLADVRPGDGADGPATAPATLKRDVTVERVDSCRPGMVCINDMSDPADDHGMEPLYRALDSLSTLGRPARIAVLGDSYIEGDILTMHLRALLQERYGGNGVGFVPMTSNVAGFRTSVRHTFGGWNEHNANDRGGYSNTWANLTGHYFTATQDAFIDLRATTALPRLSTCDESSLYFAGTGTGEVTAVVNDSITQHFTLNGTGRVGRVTATCAGGITHVRWTVKRGGGLTFLGASMDPRQGVVVDNFALRSSSGLHLKNITDAMLTGLDRERRYDLVVLMYGLNVAGKNSKNFTAYSDAIELAVNNLKRTLPATGVLIVSSSDREGKAGGGFKTYPGVLNLIAVQQQMAFDTHTAFWNLYEAMGGEGSIVAMVQNHQANLDYTHINFRGGERIAGIMAEALLWGHECHRMTLQRINDLNTQQP